MRHSGCTRSSPGWGSSAGRPRCRRLRRTPLRHSPIACARSPPARRPRTRSSRRCKPSSRRPAHRPERSASSTCATGSSGSPPRSGSPMKAAAPCEHDLQQLAGPLDEVVRMIETARRPRAGAPAPAPEPSGVLAEPGLGGEVAAGPPERARLESARRATDRVELLAAAEAEVESARTALADAQARSVALEAEGRRARAEIERLELAERDGRAERERMETELTEIRARFDEPPERGS